jgi:hypothetical protein
MNKTRTLDNVQNCYNYINILSSQIYRPTSLLNHRNIFLTLKAKLHDISSPCFVSFRMAVCRFVCHILSSAETYRGLHETLAHIVITIDCAS